MYNQRKSKAHKVPERVDYINGTKANLSQNDKPDNNGHFAFGRAGFDYFMDNRNTFTLSGVIVRWKIWQYRSA